MSATPTDLLRRPLRDLRISVTDRCNFRCRYCMPRERFGESFRYLPHGEILTYEEIARVARLMVGLGVRKLRITGGEPLLRSDLPELVRLLARLRDVDLALTTNGSLLADQAKALAEAGLRRVTVSLDSLREEVFRRMNDVAFSVADVLAGIDAARAAGLGPIKVNAVIRRGTNEEAIADLARFGREQGLIVRFIEYMDVGTTNGWRLEEVVTASEIVQRLGAVAELDPVPANYPGEVARRWRYRDGGGEVGVIASVTQPFCGGCTRARISADGKLFTCLFASSGADLREPLRAGASDEELTRWVAERWTAREDRYSELRSAAGGPRQRAEMSYLGG